jgi:hypothetical protein
MRDDGAGRADHAGGVVAVVHEAAGDDEAS